MLTSEVACAHQGPAAEPKRLNAAAAESTPLAVLGLLGVSGAISLLSAELTTALKTEVMVGSAAWSWTAPAAGCRGLAAWAVTRNTTCKNKQGAADP